MFKIAGVNLLAVLAAAVVMFLIGFVFYGLLFSEIYMTSRGVTAEDFAGQSPFYMVAGFMIEVALAIGLGWLLKRLGVTSLGAAAITGLTIAILIGFPILAYEFAYNAFHDASGLLVDWAHLAATFVTGSVVLQTMSDRSKPG